MNKKVNLIPAPANDHPAIASIKEVKKKNSFNFKAEP